MNYKSVKGYTGWKQLGVLFAFLCLGFILALIFQFIISMQLIPSGLAPQEWGDAMMKAFLNPANAIYLQISQVIGTFFLMFLPAFLYTRICHGRNKLWLGFSNHINLWQVMLGFLIIFCANIVANPAADLSESIIAHFPRFNTWAKALEDTYNEQVVAMSNLKNWKDFFIAIVIIAFFPAVFEEMLFRGALQNLLVKWWKRPVLAIVFTAVLFSFIHGSAYLFLSRVILGFVLGWMYYRSKNLWVNIIAHFLNNAIAIVQMFVLSRTHTKVSPSDLDVRMPLWLELLAILILYGLFILFGKISARNRAKIEMEEQKLSIASTPEYNLA